MSIIAVNMQSTFTQAILQDFSLFHVVIMLLLVANRSAFLMLLQFITKIFCALKTDSFNSIAQMSSINHSNVGMESAEAKMSAQILECAQLDLHNALTTHASKEVMNSAKIKLDVALLSHVQICHVHLT